MLSAFTAQPIVELKQRDKIKIESILAYGTSLRNRTVSRNYVLTLSRRQTSRRPQHRLPSHLPRQRSCRLLSTTSQRELHLPRRRRTIYASTETQTSRLTKGRRKVLEKADTAIGHHQRSRHPRLPLRQLHLHPRTTNVRFARTIGEDQGSCRVCYHEQHCQGPIEWDS